MYFTYGLFDKAIRILGYTVLKADVTGGHRSRVNLPKGG